MATTFSPAGEVGTQDSGRRLGLALLVIATAQLMVVLDATIVNVALPHIQTALRFSGSGLEWVVNAYALALGGLLLLGGRAGDLLGRRRMLVAGWPPLAPPRGSCRGSGRARYCWPAPPPAPGACTGSPG